MTSLAFLETIFSQSSTVSKLCWNNFGVILAHLGPSCSILGYLETLFGPAWGYLGLLKTILNHFGDILGPRAF